MIKLDLTKSDNKLSYPTLSGQQQQASEWLEQQKGFCVLIGDAGTGKTTVVADYARKFAGKVIASAPTHKAADVFGSKMGDPASTVHKVMDMKQKYHKEGMYFIQKNIPKISTDVLVMDESSMIGNVPRFPELGEVGLLDVIKRTCTGEDGEPLFKVIYLGDEKQLNPVGESTSPVFHQDYPTFRLTEFQRFDKDSDLIDLSQNLQWLNFRKKGKSFDWCSPNELPIDALVESNGTDLAKYLTWTNKDVDLVNNFVRVCIYGKENPPQFEVGETILTTSQYGSYHNNQEVKINHIDEMDFNWDILEIANTKNLPQLKVKIINTDLVILDSDFTDAYNIALKLLRQRAELKLIPWSVINEKFKPAFCKYQYNHALTIHRSQGSTYETSLVNIGEIMRNRDSQEKQRMLYTAVTRASKFNQLF